MIFAMQVDKDKFDALLGRLIQMPAQETKTIKGQPGNTAPVIPSPLPSTPHKA